MLSSWFERLFLSFLIGIGRLPPGWRTFLARMLQRVGWLWRKNHGNIRVNAELCSEWLNRNVPDYDPDSFIRGTLQFYIENAFEYGTVLHQSLEVQRARYDIDSLTAFQVRARELERQGRGLVVLGGHLGNTEHMSYPLVCVGMPVAALYSRSRQPALENAILRLRSQWGLDMCPADLSGVRRLYTCLRRGGMVAMLADQRPGRRVQRAYAPFLGCEGLSPAILPELIRRTGCAVLAMAVIRGEGGRLEVIYNEVDEAIADPDDEVAVTAQNDAISRLISRAPEQYFWHYRRFTRRRVEPRNPYKD